MASRHRVRLFEIEHHVAVVRAREELQRLGCWDVEAGEIDELEESCRFEFEYGGSSPELHEKIRGSDVLCW